MCCWFFFTHFFKSKFLFFFFFYYFSSLSPYQFVLCVLPLTSLLRIKLILIFFLYQLSNDSKIPLRTTIPIFIMQFSGATYPSHFMGLMNLAYCVIQYQASQCMHPSCIHKQSLMLGWSRAERSKQRTSLTQTSETLVDLFLK